jgi:N-acetylglutamate synthase-like GNAT family acetyltransferase
MSDATAVIREASAPGDLGWMIMAHGELYAREYGWDATFEALVARILTDYANADDGDRAQAWIGEVDGRRAGCVMCCPDDETTAELHTLLVEPWARGHHLGTRLVDQCLEFARKAGYARMKLWTNAPLVAARHVYLSRGFRLVREEAHRSFGVDLVGQYYELDLC